jgi:1,4-dihydroxy-2-naphthoyl-CoA synthase
MTYETIRLDTDGAVARLTLDRPAVLNAINRARGRNRWPSRSRASQPGGRC